MRRWKGKRHPGFYEGLYGFGTVFGANMNALMLTATHGPLLTSLLAQETESEVK